MQTKTKKYKIVMTRGEVQEVEGKVFSVMTLPKHSFGVRKEGKVFVADHLNSGRSIGVEEKTEKAAIDKVYSILSDKNKVDQIKRAPSVEETIKGFESLEENIKDFEEITEMKLPYNSAFGVDLLALDKELQTPADISMSDFIKEKYGEKADAILTEIVNSGLVVANIPAGALAYFIKKNW